MSGPETALPRKVTRLGLALALTILVFGVGAVQKASCADRAYVERQSGVTFQCYSDVADLLRTQQLIGGRLPYLHPCAPTPAACDEYPLGSMYIMRATASLAPEGVDPYTSFFWTNAVVLLVCALITTCGLYRLGGNTLMFAGAPMLAMYGTMNWDLIPVAMSTLATLALVRGQPSGTGVLLGLGGVVKIYPLLLTIPFTLDRWMRGSRADAMKLAAWATGVWVALNLPFALLGTKGWLNFFRFNGERPADFDSLWRVACEVVCPSTGVINVLSLGGTITITFVVWRSKIRRSPATPIWHMGFPLLVAFLLTNKVSSPQYGLWLLPWFALVAPSFRPFLAYQASEVAVFLARFSFFPSPSGVRPLSYAWLALALVVRASTLIWCLVEWMRSRDDSRPATAETSAVGVPG